MHQIAILAQALRAHTARVRHQARRDDGYTTETIVVTALLAALALGVVAVVASKVMGRANGIDLG
ncbi:hypothetical protein DVA86_27730 [Streptomyces armeniacus]|uniref:Uncharacterized protein n=1 Tax=Streptomyces armeniacus TaxID=83291 RepID=A0A345XW35_9ACTN|nr:hypothetical protein [Streptomyces armeniacus]AXK35851.1 hypothetical protein DVA86_27730 [Streptomyces armeniacus]